MRMVVFLPSEAEQAMFSNVAASAPTVITCPGNGHCTMNEDGQAFM